MNNLLKALAKIAKGVSQVDVDEVRKLQKEFSQLQKKLRLLQKRAENYVDVRNLINADTELNKIQQRRVPFLNPRYINSPQGCCSEQV